MFSWLFKSGPGQPLDEAALRDTLDTNVWQHRFLDEDGRQRVAEVATRLLRDKEWVGGSGFALKESMRATVAGVAALTTLGLDKPFFFPRLKTIILYPRVFDASRPTGAGVLSGLGGDGDTPTGGGARLGEAWQGGPVILSWADVQRTARSPGRGQNLVLHELAHHLDGLDGMMDGQPVMPSGKTQQDWRAVTDSEYHRLVGQSRRGEATLLDTYGATKRSEFFAVSVECFFERPHEMRERHPQLYALLTRYFHQSPAEWLPDLREQHRTPAVTRCRKRRCRCREMSGDYSHLGLSETDRRFSRGVELIERGQPADAIAELNEVLRATPDDAEALSLRATARLQEGDDRGALSDAEKSLELEADDLDALLVAADAGMALGDDRTAARRVKRALDVDKRSANAWLLSGILKERSGDLRGATRALKRATALEPHDAEAHYLLGRVCEARGDDRGASASYARAEELEPGADFEAP